MKVYWGSEVQLHAFFNLGTSGGEWLASRPGRFTPRETAPRNRWIGGWAGPRACLDAAFPNFFCMNWRKFMKSQHRDTSVVLSNFVH